MITEIDVRELTELLSGRRLTPDKIVAFARVYARIAQDDEYKRLYDKILALTDALKALGSEDISAMLNDMADDGDGSLFATEDSDFACGESAIDSVLPFDTESMSIPFCLSAAPNGASGFELSELCADGDMQKYEFENAADDFSNLPSIKAILSDAPDIYDRLIGRVCLYLKEKSDPRSCFFIALNSIVCASLVAEAGDSAVEMRVRDETGNIVVSTNAKNISGVWCAKLTIPNAGRYRLEIERKVGQ